MLRLPVVSGTIRQKSQVRFKSSNFIRNTFVEYFVESHGHKHVRSSPVVPLCDPTVPFVNAGMNQFKGVFLGVADAPCPRAVNSQKCVRVGGKHNDLELVGLDGHHHTFFEMLGNWSFGDYYKKEACQMAWDLLLGPYRLKPEQLLVTYFSGDAVIGLTEDRECRDIWRSIGVPQSRIIGHGARDNFWEMGASGPCGPCTEIHYVHPDGSLTEIWNIVFIQCNREADGAVTSLARRHVDTGAGLERLAALLQAARCNYTTDLFAPLLHAAHANSKGVPPYGGSYAAGAALDQAYRRLADHARMVSVCLADGAFPATSLNLKQIMRKSFKMCADVFNNPDLLPLLYDEVAATLGHAYPELVTQAKAAKLVMEQERDSYAKLRATLAKKWKGLVKAYPEVEGMADVELAGFPLGYKEFKETMAKQKSTVIPGELVFKLYDTHGFQEDIIERIATLNGLSIDRKGFWKLLSQHKARHKTALKEQTTTKGRLFDKAVENLVNSGHEATEDQHKYNYSINNNQIVFKPLKTKLVAILNEDAEWVDYSQPSESKPYYLVTERTNFYCEEGGQAADDGVIIVNEDISFKVDSVFKIRDFVFHKGHFSVRDTDKCVDREREVTLIVNSEQRLNLMRNHTAAHLLNAAVRRALPGSVVCQVGSSVTDKGLSLNFTVYGEKLSQAVVTKAEELVRESIRHDVAVSTRVVDSTQLGGEGAVHTVPGETYPESGLRVVAVGAPLHSKELCCGTHVPSTALLGDFCVTALKGAGSASPAVHAVTGAAASQVRELYSRAEALTAEPWRGAEAREVRARLAELGGGGAPAGLPAAALRLLDALPARDADGPGDGELEPALLELASSEVSAAEAAAGGAGRRWAALFVRGSYLLAGGAARGALARAARASARPVLLVGCAGGVLVAAAHVPQEAVTRSFTARSWLACVLPLFRAAALPAAPHERDTFAEMAETKVSLITCEQLVQEALRAAEAFALEHLGEEQPAPSETRHSN